MLSPGQERAICEIERIQAASQNEFEVIGSPQLDKGRVVIRISFRIGVIERREGGLNLREREEFFLKIPRDFPFEYPTICITDDRFVNFPHVIWSDWICLYQSKLEWNPADGLYGFFDRFQKWLWKATINDMDPLEGPLEPPHHLTTLSQVPFLVSCNVPVIAGTSWYGLAELERHPNRIELVGWNDLTVAVQEGRDIALAIILPKPLPMQFPKMGADLFKEFNKQGLDRNQIIRILALASLFTLEGHPIHLIVGLPMRRAADGSPRIHVAVWSTPPEFTDTIRKILPKNTDSESIRTIRQELSDILYSLFEKTEITWCQIMENRPEIIVRRDKGTFLEWFADKRILVLGCGALGSWVAEMLVRMNPRSLHVLGNASVKPGVLARQNYLPADIGSGKAEALARRLKAVAPQLNVEGFKVEAHGYLTGNPAIIHGYDAVIDCTASAIFQMKLERDWRIFGGQTPPIISMITDAKAKQCLCVCVSSNSTAGMWDAYVQLKYRLCTHGNKSDFVSAFYAENAAKDLFQPEPGCSDPTFSGSTADVCGVVSAALNIAAEHLAKGSNTIGVAFSTPGLGRCSEKEIFELAGIQETVVGNYRVRIASNVYREAKAWVYRNNRVRSRNHKTGGLLWGYWDDAIGIIWIFDASGPPIDSQHNVGNFVCGINGPSKEHKHRIAQSFGTCGFVGLWHTHPDMVSTQSIQDIRGMAELVSRIGQNQKRSVMLIFGRTAGRSTASLHVYESHLIDSHGDFIEVGVNDILLEEPVI